MQKTSYKLCGSALVMGIFGAFFRWVQLRRAREADTGLFISGSPWSIWIFLYLAAIAAALFLLVRAQRGRAFPPSYPAVYAHGNRAIKPLSALAGFLLALGGLLTIVYALRSAATAATGINGSIDYTPVFDLILGLFALGCAVAASVFIGSAGNPKPVKGYGASAFVVLFLCFWLIAAYKYSANDPVVWNFAIRLVTISSAVLSFYYAAGFVYQKPHPLAALYFALLTVVLCTVTLADAYPLGEQLIVFAFLLYSLLLAALELSSSGTQKQAEDSADE